MRAYLTVMAGGDTGQLLYLVLLGVAIGGYFIAAHRGELGRMLRFGLLWGMIFLGAIAAFGLWPGIREKISPRQSYVGESGRIVAAPRRADGHYHLTLGINGTSVDFVVDTGASDMVLSRRDAQRAGIDPGTLAYLGRAQTANGMTEVARVTLDKVTLGPITDRNVAASVNGGEMSGSLLGMSYLQRFSRIEIADNRLLLER